MIKSAAAPNATIGMPLMLLFTFSVLFGFGHFGPPPPADPMRVALRNNEMARGGWELFKKEWEELKNGEADGLGPLFNATSCQHCHPHGGAAGNEHNVQLISFVEKRRVKPQDRQKLLEIEGVPFQGGRAGSFMLPRQATYESYAEWRKNFLGLVSDAEDPKRKKAMERSLQRRFLNRSPVHVLRETSGHQVVLSERNTPALYGLGLLGNVTLETLQEIEKRQASQSTNVSGRVPPASGGQPGRFGWRGQIATIERFVTGACANELGLQSKEKTQLKGHSGRGVHKFDDIDRLQILQIVAFVEALPRPVQEVPDDPKLRNELAFGKSLLRSVGCTTCHMPDLPGIEDVFSDLLLHDMGTELADPVAALPKVIVTGTEVVTDSYFGSSLQTTSEIRHTNVKQEWRTPPLWGIADSAPYLHDGRASTLMEAIRWHGGEAFDSKRRFYSLSQRDQKQLIAFLKTLQAPKLAPPLAKKK